MPAAHSGESDVRITQHLRSMHRESKASILDRVIREARWRRRVTLRIAARRRSGMRSLVQIHMSNSLFTVVPAKAGTHNHQPALLRQSRVTAFFNTRDTAYGSLLSQGRQRCVKHTYTFPRHVSRPGDASSRPSANKRAQGMPVRRSHPQPCVQNKKARKQVTTGTPKHPAFPARWASGLYVFSPVSGLVSHRGRRDARASSPT
jgi:hypothetical protein